MGDNLKTDVEILETDESSWNMAGRSKMEEESEVDEASLLEEGSKTEDTKVQSDKKFFLADQGSEWYMHLSQGRCNELLGMLKEEPLLLRQKGKGNVTVLHKAVQHSHVALVHFVIEDMFDNKGISTHFGNQLTLEDLLCEKDDREITAVMLAAMIGPWEGIYIFERAIINCDNNQKTEACELETTDYRTNCSGVVGEHYLREHRLFEQNLRAKDPASRLLAGTNVIRAVERFKRAGLGIIYHERTETSDYMRVIKPIVKGILDENDDDIMDLKEAFKRRDDYNCAQIEELFFHFLCGCCEIYHRDFCFRVRWKRSAARVAQKIVGKIMDCSGIAPHDCMFDLFDYLDPQGRTPLHVAGMAGYEVHKEYKFPKCGIIAEVLKLIPNETLYHRCVNVRDGAGRTIFHQSCILNYPGDWQQILEDGRVNLDARVDLDARMDWDDFKKPKRNFGPVVHHLLYWRSPAAQFETWVEDIPPEDLPMEYSNFYPTSLHLLILYGREDMLEQLLHVAIWVPIDVNARLWRGSLKSSLTPLQLAAALGREKMVDMLLKHDKVKDNGKLHGPRDESDKYSVIHVAAAYKRLKVLQTILENKDIYDPMITKTSGEQESPLHLVALTRKLPDPIMLEDILIEGDMHTLKRCLYKYKGLGNESLQKHYDANDIVCINTMLQVGFDIWCCDKDGREPYPGVDASIEAYRSWYERVETEVFNYKQKLNGAMGAISVIATLVATASFIGPLQPPLGYDGVDGYVQTSYVLVRTYFVCNGLSFYFAVASLLAAVTPAIPMLRESTQDEIRRSQRNSKIAMSLLLFSIIAILVSFSCSSIVVMRPFYGHDRRMMFYTIGVGASVCTVILVLFTIRMIGQIFNQPDLMKRFRPFKRIWQSKRF
ncbi:hypothetical protein KC19_9G068900 [Ceratodon purpureus]|uniref:PGG domain-containing protein n=1 Tax=Ceratodon purpureus TaxID=3225 RepID=A0A8T0GPH3_CERPU|nr:hypothetical protein KC19_9G068900 [Ceratodon purpureus]